MGSSICNSFTGVPPVSTPSPCSLVLDPAPPALQPFCLESWLYGLTSFVPMTLKCFLPSFSLRKPDMTLGFKNKGDIKD